MNTSDQIKDVSDTDNSRNSDDGHTDNIPRTESGPPLVLECWTLARGAAPRCCCCCCCVPPTCWRLARRSEGLAPDGVAVFNGKAVGCEQAAPSAPLFWATHLFAVASLWARSEVFTFVQLTFTASSRGGQLEISPSSSGCLLQLFFFFFNLRGKEQKLLYN